MPKVTKELMKSLKDAKCFPPRHPHGCPKNFARCLPMLYAARGWSIEAIREEVTRDYNNSPCECKEQDVLRER